MAQETFQISRNLVQQISAEQAFHYRIVPYQEAEGKLIFKTDNSDLVNLSSELHIVLDRNIDFDICTREELQNYLAANYRQNTKQNSSQLEYTPDFLEKILLTAKEIKSSDIHFEPYETQCRIRFRLDGKLLEQYRIPLHEYPVIINKIKIRADLDIAEKRLPQDGRITIRSSIDEFDIRVSSLPTLHGEKIVLRILNKDSGTINISELGFTDKALLRYKAGIRKTNGMVLISGPTGSGKTTTLYATLKLLNDHKTNILTIEDPIEYTMEGINQVQLKESIGLDFANAMRTFLRQDPDIIMVGEIRDVKTANMAIRAALTGHLVLSTIHTNSAWATISRLIDMGVPPFLIASTLNLSVAQRLIRKLCPNCRNKEKMVMADQPKEVHDLEYHYTASGCIHCHHTGYSGRKALYEILPVTEDLEELIKTNQQHIKPYLEENNIDTLKENALQLVNQGITSIAEVYPIITA